MSPSARESDPLVLRTDAPSSTTSTSTASRHCGGFEQQKRAWAATAQRSQRLRAIATLQLLLGLLACGNYLWLSNVLMAVVGVVGSVAGRSERTSWVVVVRLVHLGECISDDKDTPVCSCSSGTVVVVVVLWMLLLLLLWLLLWLCCNCGSGCWHWLCCSTCC